MVYRSTLGALLVASGFLAACGGAPAPGTGAGGAATGTGGRLAGSASGGADGAGSGGAIGSGGAASAPGSGGRAAGGGGGGGGGGRSGGAGGMVGAGGIVGTGGRIAAGGATGATGGAPARANLEIHWIDVEGGASTLLIAPTGQSLLVDAGFSGLADRDVNRVLATLAAAGITRLDHVLTTHYHNDHVGGVIALASRFPVGQFLDHGPSVEGAATFNSYMTAIAGKPRVIVRPGDRLQLGEVEILFVTAGGQVIDPPPAGAVENPRCAGATMMAERPTDENPQSVGFIARFGTFDFLDLGDLTWQMEHRLVCPTNRVGTVNLFQVSHHGQALSNAPQLVHAVAPLVAVMNNGATKGGDAATFDTLMASPGLLALWQVHRAANNDAAHNAEEALIANISTAPDGAHAIRAAVARDGTFTLTNARTGQSRAYRAR